MTEQIRVGFDIGGTKIEVAALDGAGAFHVRKRRKTPDNYESMIQVISELLAEAEGQVGIVDRVGIGIPGAVSTRTGQVRNSNVTFLNGRNFSLDLAVALDRPTRVANDADCFTLSEAEGIQGVVFGAIVGTGCGGGLAVDETLLPGSAVGEWGHIPMPTNGQEEQFRPPCWCGRTGCLETWISGTGFERDWTNVTGVRSSAADIVTVARDGGLDAALALDRYIDRLGRALAIVVNVVDPQAIVLGGGMSNVSEIYDRIHTAIAPHVFSPDWSGVVRKAQYGDSSGVRGAARLWA